MRKRIAFVTVLIGIKAVAYGTNAMSFSLHQFAVVQNSPEDMQAPLGNSEARVGAHTGCVDDTPVAPGWWLIPAAVSGALCWYAILKLVAGALS